jgi:hypothetical protein
MVNISTKSINGGVKVCVFSRHRALTNWDP